MRVAVLLAVVVAAGAFGASASSSSVSFFRTPSGNIGCVYASAFQGQPASLRCDIRSGLKPKPAKPRNCHLDWGDSYELPKSGRAVVTCHGDTALDPHAPVLAYGNTWRRNGFKCVSRSTGLRCSNPGGHGFFLSRTHSYRF